jgi:hypothetical protein
MLPRRSALVFTLFLCCSPCMGATLQLNSQVVNPSLFRVTQFASLGAGALSIVPLSDGTIAIANQPGIQRLIDADQNGIADGPGAQIFASAGDYTGLIAAGGYYLSANSGGPGNSPAITFLKPGANAADPLVNAGSLTFGFASNWEHSQMGIAARPSPNRPGSWDVVFNVGSQYDHQTSTSLVQLSGLASDTLKGDSLYAVTVDFSGSQPVASNVRMIASGIRNVIGMGFQPSTGDFYFADNAIDGTGPYGDEPPQAEEINRISAASFDSGTPPDFGYPNCYIQYRTGNETGSGCVQPLFAIQPLPNGTALGSESEGVTQFDFAPANFPSGFNNGIFLGFAGKYGLGGPANEENAVGYYDFGTGNYIHFSENSQVGVLQPIGIRATSNSLFIADYGSGKIYEVTAIPEPSSFLLLAAGIATVSLIARGVRAESRKML